MAFGNAKKTTKERTETVSFTIPGTVTVRKFPDGSETTDAVVTDDEGNNARMRIDPGTLVAMARNLGIGASVEVPVVVHKTSTYKRADGTEGTRIHVSADWTQAKGVPVPAFMRSEPRIVTVNVGEGNAEPADPVKIMKGVPKTGEE